MSIFNELLSVRPTPVDEVTINVVFDGSQSEANVLWNDLVGMVAYSCGCSEGDSKPGTLGVSFEEVRDYMDALLYMRVKYVRRDLPPDLRNWYEYPWVIPALTCLIFKQMGRAEDVDLGVVLIPETNLPQPDPVKMQKVSRAMRAAHSRYHLMVGEELPRDRSGAFEFMATTVLNNEVLAHSKETHPTTAFLASVAANHALQDIFSPRVAYGSTAFFRKFLTENVVDGILRKVPNGNPDVETRNSQRDKRRRPESKGAKKSSEPAKAVDGSKGEPES